MRISHLPLSKDPVLHRIMRLLQTQKRTEKELIDHLGIVRGSFTSWKYKNVKSYLPRINDIADFLGVSPSYLLRGVDDEVNMETLSETELMLIKRFREFRIEAKSFILEAFHFAELLAKGNKNADTKND